MIIFFLLSRFLNWRYMWALHYVNIIFLIPAVFYSVYRLIKKRGSYPYLNGFVVGISVAVKGGLIFCFFLLLYLQFIDPGYMIFLHEDVALGQYMNPILLALVLLTEQVCAGLIITLIIMQIFKNV